MPAQNDEASTTAIVHGLSSIVQDLGIDVPIYRVDRAGEDATIYLYGGQVLTYSPSGGVGGPSAVPPSPGGRGAGGEGPNPKSKIGNPKSAGDPPSSAGVEAASSSAPARGKKGKATKCPS